jgi:hypothetical protein
LVKIIKNIDLDWWTKKVKELSITQDYLGREEIDIKMDTMLFYKINEAIKEMEKKEMPPKNMTNYTLECSTENGVTFNYIPTLNFSDIMLKSDKVLKVKSIKYDKNYTTVTWNDGTKTTVRCSNEDDYSRYTGFCSALAKKIFGTSSQVRKIVETKNEEIELAKKKAELKEKERLAEIARKRKERHQIKYRAKQIVIEKKAKQLAKKMLGE